ncbi:hypothetical protein QBC46DRAFT_110839 [Diplogelasinospora grovesii]|uniref:F-box domain-containing protein n=1 Tax=Diplogelasinospora grovesii TaxID=303347 RepID=A0AAN6NA54_9PEZI|nr:hypothetical protein QBC46DRAFT_110839 [Diplogelasinospora grovesii]
MGQSFRLVAPRAEIYLPWGGNLREMLFDGSARNIAHLLAVPVRPRKSSVSEAALSTTQPAQSRNDRSAAQTSASSSPQQIRVDKHAKRKADDEVPGGCPRRHHKLAKAKSCDPGDGADADTDRSVTISDLPREVHRLIFDHVEFIEDVVCLGLVCTF